jgi:glucose uptake protein GlcU
LILSITAIAFSQFPALLDNLKEQASGYQVPIVAPIVKFIPQAIGACSIGCLIIYIRAKIKKDLSVFKIKATYLNIFNGFIYAIGMIFYLYSVFLLNKNTNQQFVNGDGIDAGAGATAFALTNFANIISAIGGIFFLHEKFNKREIIYFIIGGIVLTIGAILITFVDQFTFLQV